VRSTLARLAAIAIAVHLAGSVAAPPAEAGHDARNCGILSKGSHDYRVRSMKMKCKQARKGAKLYLRTGEARAGFDCAPTAGNSFYCQNPPKAYWATRL
jgi:hypothetical protein